MAFIRNNRFFILLAGALLIGVLFAFLERHDVSRTPGFADGVLVSGDTRIAISVADTPATREQGLSGTGALPEDTGKLFVFDDMGMYGFWMKDMAYALDIVWLDGTLTVVDITKDIRPDTYPTVFYPKRDILYALEVPAGFTDAASIGIGQMFRFEE